MYKLANYWCNLTFVTFEGFYQHTQIKNGKNIN